MHARKTIGPMVRSMTFKGDSPDPVVSVSMVGYVTRPPGVMASVTPEVQSKIIKSPSEFTFFTFKVCAKGNVAGNFTFQATISGIKPARACQVEKPDPPDSGRVAFDVAP